MKFLKNSGAVTVRQKGSHLIYHHPDAKRAVVIPRYDEVLVTVIKNNMRTVNMRREEYFRLFTED